MQPWIKNLSRAIAIYMSRVGMLDPRQNADADPKASNKISKAPESMIKSYNRLLIFFLGWPSQNSTIANVCIVPLPDGRSLISYDGASYPTARTTCFILSQRWHAYFAYTFPALQNFNLGLPQQMLHVRENILHYYSSHATGCRKA